MGLFVRQFAIELSAMGHNVVVQPVARKNEYFPDPGISIVPTPWKGGDQELASMNLMSPKNWWYFLSLFISGIKNTNQINDKYKIDRTLCMLLVPSGIFGITGKFKNKTPYDVWVLGSDLWKIRKIPFLGKIIISKVVENSNRVFADGLQLCQDVQAVTGEQCELLHSSRKLPLPQKRLLLSDSMKICHLLYVGRYHINKGPDLLIKAIGRLPNDARESVRVHMFGLGPMELKLKSMISELRLENYIHLHGPIEAQEFSDYLQSVSYLVIPSRIESIPVVFSDALQLGTPIISMPVGDLEGLIKRHKCGLVARETSPEALAVTINEALSKSKDSFQEGISTAFEQFKINKTVHKWLNL
jgi:hypothetical protein